MRVSIEVFSQPEAAELIQIIEQLAYLGEYPAKDTPLSIESLSKMIRYALISVFDTQQEVDELQLAEFKRVLHTLEVRADEYYTTGENL